MDRTEWEIPIYESDRLRGRLHVDRQGLRTVFRTQLPGKGAGGIQKLWLQGARSPFLLGTLIPEGTQLRLERTVSNALLREKGLEHCQRAELQVTATPPPARAANPWQPVDRLTLPDPDGELAQAIRGLRGGVWRREGAYIRICCPWQIGQRMPCMPLFCFASYSTRRGGMLSWILDELGNPCIKPR